MERVNTVMTALVLAFFIFGCTGRPPDLEGSDVNATGGVPSEPDSTGYSPPDDAGSVPSYDGTTRGRAVVSPIQCSIVQAAAGGGGAVTEYIHPQYGVRVEFIVDDPECRMSIFVIKPGRIYFSCPGSTTFSPCDWIVSNSPEAVAPFSTSDDEVAIICDTASANPACRWWVFAEGASGSFNVDVPEAGLQEIKCTRWNYDASKFSTPGRACTIEEWTDEILARAQREAASVGAE